MGTSIPEIVKLSEYYSGGFTQKYEPNRFVKIMERTLQVNDLRMTHLYYPRVERLVKTGADSQSVVHQIMFSAFNHEDVKNYYIKFIKDFVRPLFAEDFYFQQIPSFRHHAPGNLAVGEFHKDSKYGHVGSINIWVPLTDTIAENTIILETKPGLKDFRAFCPKVGEMLIFDGCKLEHGNLVNTSGQSRISFDMRILPVSEANKPRVWDGDKNGPSTPVTVQNKTRIAIGDYYNHRTIDNTETSVGP